MHMKTTERFISLDVFRGLTVAGMILVNSPGQGATFTTLRHAPWNGCRIADFVYPFFLFIVGAAIYFAFRKSNFELTPKVTGKIFKRGVLIFFIGFLLNIFPFTSPPEYWRILGVLQRIAIVYVAASFLVLWLKTTRKLLITAGIIMVGYWWLLAATGYTLENSIVLTLDKFLFGEKHLYQGYGIPFDPEGLISSIPSIANALFGFLGARMLMEGTKNGRLPLQMLWAGLGMVVVALGWNLIFPFNKPLWTSSFVLYTSGWAMIIWFFFFWLIDCKKIKGWTPFFLVFGTNALFTYILSDILAIINWKCPFQLGEKTYLISTWLDEHVYGVLTQTPVRSMLWGITMVILCWAITYPLYKKHIYIKL